MTIQRFTLFACLVMAGCIEGPPQSENDQPIVANPTIEQVPEPEARLKQSGLGQLFFGHDRSDETTASGFQGDRADYGAYNGGVIGDINDPSDANADAILALFSIDEEGNRLDEEQCVVLCPQIVACLDTVCSFGLAEDDRDMMSEGCATSCLSDEPQISLLADSENLVADGCFELQNLSEAICPSLVYEDSEVAEDVEACEEVYDDTDCADFDEFEDEDEEYDNTDEVVYAIENGDSASAPADSE